MPVVNPFLPAVEVWLAIWNNLPPAVLYLASFSLGLLIFLTVFHIIMHIRG